MLVHVSSEGLNCDPGPTPLPSLKDNSRHYQPRRWRRRERTRLILKERGGVLSICLVVPRRTGSEELPCFRLTQISPREETNAQRERVCCKHLEANASSARDNTWGQRQDDSGGRADECDFSDRGA